jgi:hypothetical protein
MLGYKLYRLGSGTQRIVSVKDVIALDDLDALRDAEKICNADAIEIWQGARCVARVSAVRAHETEMGF